MLTGIIVLYIVLGCLMNVIPMILLTLPAIFPTVKALGFDPIWFGVLTVMIMEMGQITPPIGVNVFALSSVADGVPMGRIFVGIIPFFICIILMMLVLIAFPPWPRAWSTCSSEGLRSLGRNQGYEETFQTRFSVVYSLPPGTGPAGGPWTSPSLNRAVPWPTTCRAVVCWAGFSWNTIPTN